MDFLRRILASLARFIDTHAERIVFAAFILTIASIVFTFFNFKVVNNISDLLDVNSPENKSYLAYKKEFGVDEEYIVVLRSDDPALNRKVADELGPQIEAIKPGIRKVFFKLDFSRLEKRFLLFQSEDELKQIEKDVSGYAAAMRQNSVKMDLNSMLDQANRSFDDKYLRKSSNWKEFKPFVDRFADMLTQLAEKIEEGKHPVSDKKLPPAVAKTTQNLTPADLDRLITEHEYPATFNEGHTLLVMATPGQRESDGASPYSGTLKKIRAILTDMRQKYPQVTFGLTGEPVLNDDEMHTASRDMTFASIITLALIITIFGVSYSRWSRPAWAITVLLMAVSWCFAYAMLSVGHLNIISQAFVPMMLGLGIDFGIQMMGRYEEELGRGKSIHASLMAALPYTGLAIVTGGSTTAAAFFTMCYNDFVGLRELGAICGGSVVLCLLANLIVLPSFYVWRDRRKASSTVAQDHHDAAFLHGPQLNEKWTRHPGAVLTAGAIATIVLGLGINKVTFDYNLLHLQSPTIASVQTLHTLFSDAGSSIIYGSVTCDTLEDARIKRDALLKLPSVQKVDSLLDVFPQDQDKKLHIVKRIVGNLSGLKLDTDVSKQVDVVKARQNIALLLDQSRKGKKEAQGYVSIAKMARDAVEAFGKLIPPLERALNAMNGLSQEELGKRLNRYQVDVFGSMQKGLSWLKHQQTDRGIVNDDIPQALRDRFIGKTGKYLLMVYPKEDIWERAPLEQFVKEVRSVDLNFTGTPTQNYAYIELLRTSYEKAACWAFVAIVILIGIHFRSFLFGALAILPLCLAVIWTLGIMGWFGIQFNPANIMTLPMVIGIGVAFGVYTVERFQEERKMNLFNGSTGKAVILSTLTAISGFASMLISKYQGLYSLGLVMTIGVSMCMVSSIVLLPQLFKLLEKKNS